MLVHDATFLNEPDRREPIHATTEEALDVAAARRRQDASSSITSRFATTAPTAMPALRAQVAASGFTGDCWLLDEADFIEITKNK